MINRPVMVSKRYRPEGVYTGPWKTREVEEGVLLEFGTEDEYPIAIVEMPDGTIRTPLLELIRFVGPGRAEKDEEWQRAQNPPAMAKVSAGEECRRCGKGLFNLSGSVAPRLSVMVSERYWPEGERLSKKRDVGEGVLLGFITEEDSDEGVAYTTAIVEMADGTFLQPRITMIRAIKPGAGARCGEIEGALKKIINDDLYHQHVNTEVVDRYLAMRNAIHDLIQSGDAEE